jgi:peptidoglycan/xylan/chitin deacetylase (PgdA/CDA1 family)
MTRWGDWTWEDPAESSAPPRTSSRAPEWLQSGQTPGAHHRRYRQRRAGAAFAAIALVALVVVAVGSGGSSHASAARQAAHVKAPALTAAQLDTRQAQAETAAIDRTLAYAPAVVSGGSVGNEVALTFDDGPGPYTTRLVSVLRALHAPATFFAVGVEERFFSAGTEAELKAGYPIEDHTQSHTPLALLSARDQRQELVKQSEQLSLLDAPYPRLFRPPYGSFNKTTFDVLSDLKMLMVLWSTDTRDFARPGTSVIVARALAGAHPGAIILMHDAGGDRSQTVAALHAIVLGLRARGLRPVTVPRLLLDDPPPPGQQIPKNLSGVG